MVLFLFVWACMSFALLAVDFHGAADVEIMYVSRHIMSFRHAYFARSAGVEVACMDGRMRNVCDVLEDQLLAAYCLKPYVPRHCWGCSELFDADVRRVTCDESGFYSPEIRACFDQIAQASDVNLGWSLFDKKLKAKHVPLYIYPEGMTRKWFVAQIGGLVERVAGGEIIIYFKGRREVLCGCEPFQQEKPDAVRPGSLLAIKRRGGQDLSFPKDQPFLESSVLSLPEFLKCMPSSQQCVGLVYFPNGGGQVRALFDLTGVSHYVQLCSKKKVKCRGKGLFESMRGALLSGFVPRCKSRSFDTAKRTHPVVRDALCYRKCFLSQTLLFSIEKTLCGFWERGEHIVRGGGWHGFTSEHFSGVCGECNTLQWELMDHDVFLRLLGSPDAEKHFEEKVFVLLQGESVVGQGTPFDAMPKA